MRIAVIGAGAMGSIFGGSLSKKNEVFLVDTNEQVIAQINEQGLKLNEAGEDRLYHPSAVLNSDHLGEMDLVILFVKALYSEAALRSNQKIIGQGTYVMTLQNGGGHEDLLKKYVEPAHIIIGTTEDDGRVLGPGYVKRGGNGVVNVGMPFTDDYTFLDQLKENFDACGFTTKITRNIQQLIWKKLFRNTTLSAVTGVLQCRIGYVYENPYAWKLVEALADELVEVATAIGVEVTKEWILEDVKQTAIHSKDGVTSICADVRKKRKTEVDTITGFVVRKAKECKIPVPSHEFVLNTIHALETGEEELIK